jgi:membrane protease YdiL (CAAX protease family)
VQEQQQPQLLQSSATTRWPRAIATLTVVYVAPVMLLLAGVVPFEWRFVTLLTMTAIAAVISAARDGFGLAVLGFTLPRLSAMASWAFAPSLALVGGVFLSGLQHRLIPVDRLSFYLFYAAISAPAQEFLYRSFLFAELAVHGLSSSASILISALLYASMHLIYRDALTFALTFFGGLMWGFVFARTRSFLTVALSHAAIGVAAIRLGVV